MRNKKDPQRLDHKFYPAQERYTYSWVSILTYIGAGMVGIVLLALLFKNLFL